MPIDTPTLLKIRFIQLKRELDNTGPSILVLLGILFLILYTLVTLYEKTNEAFYITAFLYCACLSIHYLRKDKAFIYSYIHNPHREIFVEYLALTLPFSLVSLFTRNWFCFPILLAALYTIPFIKGTFRQKTYFKRISSFLPVSNFEWIGGFRKSFVYLIPLYILALCLCWFKFISLIMLWFITVTIISFYQECEPLHVLKADSLLADEFLKHKMFQHSKHIVLLYAPLVIINTIFNFEYWFINLLFIPIQLSIICFAICLKYSGYTPNKNASGNNVILSLVSLGSVFPYLLPIPVVMATVYYSKAKNNLKKYLND